jgi:hypothetical protein
MRFQKIQSREDLTIKKERRLPADAAEPEDDKH